MGWHHAGSLCQEAVQAIVVSLYPAFIFSLKGVYGQMP